MKTGVKVCDAMTKEPILVKANETLVNCAKQMKEHRISALLVKDEGELGILTDKDIVRKLVAENKNPIELKARDVMTTVLQTVSPAHDIFEALTKMGSHDVNHMPVVDQGNLIGLLTVKDILKIEPQLFDILVDKFEIREEESKLQALDRKGSELKKEEIADEEVEKLIG